MRIYFGWVKAGIITSVRLQITVYFGMTRDIPVEASTLAELYTVIVYISVATGQLQVWNCKIP
jgi:hypothetical protein